MIPKKERDEIFEKVYSSELKKNKGKRPSNALMKKVSKDVANKVSQKNSQRVKAKIKRLSIDHSKNISEHFNGMDETLHPNGLKYSCNLGNYELLVIEETPHVRTVSTCIYDHQKDEDVFKNHRISFPYGIFFITLQRYSDGAIGYDINYFFRNSPLTSMDDNLFVPPLPNRFDECKVCMGDEAGYWTKEDSIKFGYDNKSKAAMRAMAEFYETSFECDIMKWGINKRKGVVPKEVKSFSDWEKETKKNPLFSLNVKWKKEFKFVKMIKLLHEDYGNGVSEKIKRVTADFVSEIGKNI